jgi:hypothetical protein
MPAVRAHVGRFHYGFSGSASFVRFRGVVPGVRNRIKPMWGGPKTLQFRGSIHFLIKDYWEKTGCAAPCGALGALRSLAIIFGTPEPRNRSRPKAKNPFTYNNISDQRAVPASRRATEPPGTAGFRNLCRSVPPSRSGRQQAAQQQQAGQRQSRSIRRGRPYPV